MSVYTIHGSLDGRPQTLTITAADHSTAEIEAEVKLRKLAARRGQFNPRIKITNSEETK